MRALPRPPMFNQTTPSTMASKYPPIKVSTDTAAFKVKALTPIVEQWNSTILSDRWQVKKDKSSSSIVSIESDDEQVISGYKGIHGILLSRIAEVANAYGWTFGIHYTEAKGLYILFS